MHQQPRGPTQCCTDANMYYNFQPRSCSTSIEYASELECSSELNFQAPLPGSGCPGTRSGPSTRDRGRTCAAQCRCSHLGAWHCALLRSLEGTPQALVCSGPRCPAVPWVRTGCKAARPLNPRASPWRVVPPWRAPSTVGYLPPHRTSCPAGHRLTFTSLQPIYISSAISGANYLVL